MIETFLSEPDSDILDAQIIADSGQTAFAANAAVLDSAGRRLHAADEPAIDPHRTGLELTRELQRARDVLTVNAGDEPVAQAIGELRGLFHRVEDLRHGDWTKDLFARQDIVGSNLVDDGGCYEIAALQ